MKPLGQIAYEAYVQFYGTTVPPYETLPAKVKEGLETGIDAVLESLPNENPALVSDLFNRCVRLRGGEAQAQGNFEALNGIQNIRRVR